MKVAVLRECLRSNWSFVHDIDATFKDAHDANMEFFAWDEQPQQEFDFYDVSEMFHDRSIKYIKEKKRVVVTTEEPSVISTLKYLNERGQNLENIINKPIHYIARTTWSRDTLLQLGVDGEKISLIPFGVNTSKFQPRNLKREFPFPTFLYVGSVSRIKGVDILLRSFKQVGKGHLLVVAGQFNNDEVLLNQLNQTPNVHVKSWRNDIEYYFNQADIYVQPQSYGNPMNGGILHFGRPLQWAVSSGLPILSLNQGAARDFIVQGRNGFLCNYADAMTDYMNQLSDNPEVVKQMGYYSRAFAKDYCSSAMVGSLYNAVYKVLAK